MKNKKLLIILLELLFLLATFVLIILFIYNYNNEPNTSINKQINEDNIEKIDLFVVGGVDSFVIEEKEYEIVSQVSMEENTNSIPVLAYHDFMIKEDKELYAPDPRGKYTMYIEDFEQQLKYLYDNGYRTINYKTLNKWLNGEIYLDNKNFIITIDDANVSSYYLAMPIIEKYDFDAIIFVIVGRTELVSNEYDASNPSFIGEDLIHDIKTNHKSIELGSHSTYLHSTIDGLNPKDALTFEQIRDDLLYSKNFLETDIFAYPFGMYNDKYLQAVNDAGFLLAFTFNPSGRVKIGTDRYQVPRININSQVNFEEFKKLVETEW